jgi:hypothetical protein
MSHIQEVRGILVEKEEKSSSEFGGGDRGKEEPVEGVSDEEGRVEGTMRKLLFVARKSWMRSSIDMRCAARGVDQRCRAILQRYGCSSLARHWIGEVAERMGATATPYVRVTQNPGQGEEDIRGWKAGMRNRRGRTVRTLGP